MPEKPLRLDLILAVSFDPVARRAQIQADWRENPFADGERRTWDVPVSGAIVAEETAFLLALRELPIGAQVTVHTRSTHVPLRFTGVWQHTTEETRQLILEAVEVARARRLEVQFFSR